MATLLQIIPPLPQSQLGDSHAGIQVVDPRPLQESDEHPVLI